MVLHRAILGHFDQDGLLLEFFQVFVEGKMGQDPL